MNAEPSVPSVEALFGQLFETPQLPPLHGAGTGFDRAGDTNYDGSFVFAHEPPNRWRLERPAGRLCAVGDDRAEVSRGRDDVVRRVGVGIGWAGEHATHLLRFPLTRIPRDEVLRMEVLEAPSVDSVFNRPTWRVTLAGPLYVWFDAVIPIVLRVASGSPARGRARMLVEITELVLGTTGPFGALDHPLLRQQQPAMSASRTDVRRLIQTVRSAVPEADNVEVLAGDTTGAFQARFLISTRVGACEVLLDRRDIAAEPYERMKAGLERDGDRRWQLSVDHDRELDPESARLLARRLALSLTDL